MDQEFYTAIDVAKRLKLHVKTVLGFVRDGRLKARRIGKQYRITAADLAAFAGEQFAQNDSADLVRNRAIEVSSIVEIDAISESAANRATTHLLGALNARPPGEDRVRLDTIYYEERARLKIIVSGSIETTSRILGMIPILIAER